jgi:plastocyanin
VTVAGKIDMNLQRNGVARATARATRVAMLAALAWTGAMAHGGMPHDATAGTGMRHDTTAGNGMRHDATDAAMKPAADGMRADTVTAGGSAEVAVANFAFGPAVLTVTPGTRVTWTNRDTSPHTVTSRDGRFTSSEGMDTGDAFSFVFDQPGTYEYFCSLHPMMVGKVIVKAAG